MVSKFDKTSELYNQSGDVEQGAAGLEDIVQHYSGSITHSNHYLLLQIYYTLAEILKKKYTAKARKQPKKKKSQGQVKKNKTSSEIELVLRVLQVRAECADALLPRYHPVKAEIYRQLHFWLRQAQRFNVSIPPKATPSPTTETAASMHALVDETNEFHKLALLNERVCFGENHDQKKGAAE